MCGAMANKSTLHKITRTTRQRTLKTLEAKVLQTFLILLLGGIMRPTWTLKGNYGYAKSQR